MTDGLSVPGGPEIPLAEIELKTSRSSGPGGQHANVTASRVEAVFDVEASSALTEAQRQRLLERLGSRISAVAQDARGQAGCASRRRAGRRGRPERPSSAAWSRSAAPGSASERAAALTSKTDPPTQAV